ncbi:MAG: hypothetical protein JWO38_5815 [Gemmataceae bacterium]|nr:hypothetical protein [Gemmataceae bacterium]
MRYALPGSNPPAESWQAEHSLGLPPGCRSHYRPSPTAPYTPRVPRKSNRRQPDRYDVTANSEAQFADRAGNVLLNKKGGSER